MYRLAMDSRRHFVCRSNGLPMEDAAWRPGDWSPSPATGQESTIEPRGSGNRSWPQCYKVLHGPDWGRERLTPMETEHSAPATRR